MNASIPSLPKRSRRKPLAIAALCGLLALAGYLGWRPIQAERAFEEASLERLQQIAAERPKDARAHYHLGLRLGRTGQNSQAFEAMTRASELAPDSEDIWIALAGAINGAKGPEASFRVMNDYLKRHPDSVKMKEQRTSLLSSLQRASDGFAGAKRYKEAIQYYRIWLAEDPTATNARQGLENALKASRSKTTEASKAPSTQADIHDRQPDRARADAARKQAEQNRKGDAAKAK